MQSDRLSKIFHPGFLLVFLLTAPVLAEPVEAEKIDAIRIEQVTSGLPGGDSGKTLSVRQVLWIDGESRRLRLEQYTPGKDKVLDTVFLLHCGKEKETSIFTLPGGGKKYREHSGDLNENQRNRRIHELEQLRILRAYSARERKLAMKKLGIREGGKRDVKLEWKESADHLGFSCRRLTVIENDTVIIDAVLTATLPGKLAETSGSYFEMYRRLGVFSEEVLDKIRGIKGIPLKAKLTVITDLPRYTISVDTRQLKNEKTPTALFELPEGAEKIVDVPTFSTCPICGTRGETEKMGRVFTENGVVYVDSERCARKLQKKLKGPGANSGTRRP